MVESIDFGSLFSVATAIFAVGSVFIEVSPIKINPWSALLKYIGNKMTEDLRKDVGELRDKVDNLEEKVNSGEVDRIRHDILNFANSCYHGTLHSKEEFAYIMNLHMKYCQLIDCEQENGQVDVDFEYIVETYKKCVESNSFL